MKYRPEKFFSYLNWNAIVDTVIPRKKLPWLRPAVRTYFAAKFARIVSAALAIVGTLGMTFASVRAERLSSQSAPTPQTSTSLNGPGNVFLTANLYGSGGVGTVFLAVADFNGDGKLDYVTAQDGNNTTTLGIAIGNGDGTFKSPSTIAIPCGAVWVATGDFNGDGKTDLAVASRDCSPGTNGVSIFLGNGDGTFSAKSTLTSPLSNPASVAAGDFSGDGKIDLAVVDRGVSTDAVFFYSGNGDGTFQAPTSVSLGGLAASNQVVVADFNKDGHLDVAVSQINGSNVVVILGNGNGSFQAPRNNALPAQGWALAVGDLNGDGVPDIVATSPSIGGVTVFLGKGDGNFTPVNNPASGKLPTADAAVPGGGCTTIAVGDFNKDGKLDIAAGLSGVNSAALVAVLPGNGNGTFGPERLFGTSDTPQSVAVGDFNGDGNLDWIASTGQINSADQGSVTVGLGRGDGTFLATESYTAAQGPSWAAAADFNKNRKLDVVVSNPPSQNISILLGNGDGTVQPAVNIPFPELSPSFVVTGDFNNDGNEDFAVFSSWCPNFVNAPLVSYLGNGDGTFQAPATSNISGLSSCGALNAMVAADFNGDGKLDIGMLLTNNSGPLIAVMLGNGDGTFQAPKTTPAPGGRSTWMSVGDLNKDGKLDAVVVQYMNNEIQVFLGNGDGTFQSPTTLATGRLPGFSVLADFNGDGKVDIVVDNQQDNNAEIYLGNGDGTFNSPSLISIAPSNSPPSIMMADDFNLDGHVDILFGHNDNRGTGISLLLGNGDGTFQPVQNYLVSGFSGVTAVGDFNGDGAPDALVLDSNEQFVSILLNQTPSPLNIAPTSLSFGNQLVGTPSDAKPINLTNNGTVAATVAVGVTGDFTETNTCPVSPGTLAVAAKCTVNVTFNPSTTGPRAGALTVSYSLPGNAQTRNLSGTGVIPLVSLNGTSINFGNQPVGSSSLVQMVNLTNTGTAPLSISSIAIIGANSGDFSQTSTCPLSPATLAIGANCAIKATFTPTTAGNRAASVSIRDDAPGNPQSVSLSGTGTVPFVTLSAVSLRFGQWPTGTTSAKQMLTVTNTGTAPLNILKLTTTGDFTETNSCSSPIAANASCQIQVTFTPSAVGGRSGTLVIQNNASGTSQITLTGFGSSRAQVGTGDFNGDGHADILWRDLRTGQDALWLMDSTMIVSGQFFSSVTDLNWSIVGVGDFNGDGKADILWRNLSTGEHVIWLMNGASILPGSAPIATVSDPNWQVVGIGDFNGDGKADILWRNLSTGQNVVWLMDGTSILPDSASIGTVSDLEWQVMGVADFDGDGKADILWRHQQTGQNAIWLMNGATIVSGQFLTTIADLNMQVVGVGDFDGDGKADILWRHQQTGQNAVWLMNGATIVSGQFLTTIADLNMQVVGVGDFDGDGKADILWRRQQTGQNAIWLMNGATIVSGQFLVTVPDIDLQIF